MHCEIQCWTLAHTFFAISSFRLGFSALKQSLIYNNFNSVLMKTNSFCTIHPERHQMLFCLWETPLCAEALSLLVYGLWLCRIFIGGLFGESQYVPCQVFKAAKPVLGNFKSRHTWGCPSLLILEPPKQIFFFSPNKPHGTSGVCTQKLHVCTNTVCPGLPSHIWPRCCSPFHILARCSGKHRAELLTLTN